MSASSSQTPSTPAPPEGWHPDSRILALSGGQRIHVVTPAAPPSAPPVVLLHGILVSSWCWRFTIPALLPAFRPIAPCQLGHGWSSKGPGDYTFSGLAGAVLRTMDQLGVERAHFIGNSLGGGVALRIAIDHPDRVSRLVLVSPAAVPLPGLRPLLGVQGAHFGALYRRVLTRMLLRTVLQRLAYHRPIVDEAFMDAVWAPLASGETWTAAGRISRTLISEMRSVYDGLPGVWKRSLVIWGEHDGLLPVHHAPTVTARLPVAESRILSGCAHSPMEERPEMFNDLVIRFLSDAGERLPSAAPRASTRPP